MSEFTEDEFENITAVNLKGVWLCMRQEMRRPPPQKVAARAWAYAT
jgi:hypothetical protein